MADLVTNPNISSVSFAEAISMSTQSIRGRYIKHLNSVPYADGKGKIVPSYETDSSTNPDISTKIVPEGTNAKLNSHKFSAVTLKPKRFAEAIELSEEFMDNSELDNQNIARELALNKIIYGISRQMLNLGYGDSSTDADKKINFERLFPSSNYTSEILQEGPNMLTQAFNYEELLIRGYEKLHGLNALDGAFWILNTGFKMSVLDANNEEKLSFKDVPKGAVATLLGMPVYRENMIAVNGATIGWGIVHPKAYSTMISDVIVKKTEPDTKQALNNSLTYTVEVWADGKITDKFAKYGVAAKAYVPPASESEPEFVEDPMAQTAEQTEQMTVQSVEPATEPVIEEKPKAKRKPKEKE